MASRWQRHALYATLLQISTFTFLAAAHWDVAHATPINLLANATFDTDLSGWTVSSQTYAGCANYSPPHQNPPAQPLDGGAVWLNACGGTTDRPEISQTISTSVGATYEVSGFVQTGFYVLDPPDTYTQFEVLAGGTPLSLTFGAPNANGWSQFSA